ncbi:hypothetical protein AB0J28_19900 [Streptosporangium canum]|uniref:hypothetical protein n=1 Tax=Streptosporangium canum TaxID=324952 RepID=UPI0034283F81
MSLSSPADVTFDELSEPVADDEAARVCLVEWWSRVPDPRSLLGRWHRFFYLDADALAEMAKKRGPHNWIGWGLQRGAARAAQTRDSRRELFDRAVLWLIENRVVPPGSLR